MRARTEHLCIAWTWRGTRRVRVAGGGRRTARYGAVRSLGSRCRRSVRALDRRCDRGVRPSGVPVRAGEAAQLVGGSDTGRLRCPRSCSSSSTAWASRASRGLAFASDGLARDPGECRRVGGRRLGVSRTMARRRTRDAEYQKALARDSGNFGVLIEARGGSRVRRRTRSRRARGWIARCSSPRRIRRCGTCWDTSRTWRATSTAPTRSGRFPTCLTPRKRRRALRPGLLAIDHGPDRGLRCLPSPGVGRGIQRREQDPGRLRSPKPPGRPVVPPLHARGRALTGGSRSAGLVATRDPLVRKLSNRCVLPTTSSSSRWTRREPTASAATATRRRRPRPSTRLARRVDAVRAGDRAELFDASQPQHDADGALPLSPRRPLQRHPRASRARDDVGGAARRRPASPPERSSRPSRSRPRFGLGQGFDTYDDLFADKPDEGWGPTSSARPTMPSIAPFVVERARRRQAVPVGAPLRRALPVRAAFPVLRRSRRSSVRRRDREHRPRDRATLRRAEERRSVAEHPRHRRRRSRRGAVRPRRALARQSGLREHDPRSA